MTQGNIAAIIVVGCVAGMFGMREIAHHRPLPLKPLPLCEEVGNAIESLPPMIHRDAVDPPTPEEATPNSPKAIESVQDNSPKPIKAPKRHKKASRPQTHVVPAPPPPPPEPGPPEHFGALDGFFNWLKSFWVKHD